MLSEKDLENLAALSRIRLSGNEKKKLVGDLEKILSHVAELKEVPTDGVPPMAASPVPGRPRGGTELVNELRPDGEGTRLLGEAARAAFPEARDGFLKIPPVFSVEV